MKPKIASEWKWDREDVGSKEEAINICREEGYPTYWSFNEAGFYVMRLKENLT